MEELVIITIIAAINLTYRWNSMEKNKQANKQTQTD